MNKATKMLFAVVMVALTLTSAAWAQEAVNVTFTVNTSTVLDTVNANSYSLFINGAIKGAGAGDAFVGGETLGWDANATATLTNVGGDYWTATYQVLAGDTLLYKYRYQNNLTNGSDDENDFDGASNPSGWGTRGFEVTKDTVLTIEYFNERTDAPLASDVVPFTSESDSVTVMFRVNVGGQVQTTAFDPAVDNVGLRGNPAFFDNPSDWSSSALILDAETVPENTDHYFYSGVVRMHKDSVANLEGEVGFKFVLEKEDGGVTWESTPDRFFAVPADKDTTIMWVYFSDTPPSNAKVVDTQLNFEVNVGILEGLGLFNSSIDTVNVTGSFNDWNNSANRMVFSDFTGNYEAFNIPLTGAVGSGIQYKYYIRWSDDRDNENSEYYLPTISATGDGWEEPGATGGGNRTLTLEDTESQPVVTQYWNGVSPDAIMLPTNVDGGAVTVTFKIDMSPALDASTPFVPATDSVFLSVEEAFFAITQDLPTYVDDIATTTLEYRDRVMFTDEDEDLVYELELPLVLPTLNQFAFNVAYGQPTSPDGQMINTGPGGTEAGRRFYKYIEPTVTASGISWPSTYEFSTLTWSDDPLVFDQPPSYTVTSNETDGDVAGEFRLEQNYPNPFNPTTNISFALPNAATVRLTVFNVLGQEVATLINNKTMTSGSHAVAFDASALSSGMYIYRLEAGNFVSTKRMMLIK